MDEGRKTLLLSDAEYDYAWRYKEYRTLGETKPDPSGFDPERIGRIQAEIDREFYRKRERLRRRR